MEKLKDLLNVAYEKELYERWLTIYPYMETGMIDFMSFEAYKNKAFSNSQNNSSNQNISDDEIKEEMLEVVKFYEQKAGVIKDGNI